MQEFNALVTSQSFAYVIMVCIMLNTMTLAMKWPGMTHELEEILEKINLGFTAIFIVEAVLKLIGLGPKAYFIDNWNRFDFLIVVLSVVELILSAAYHRHDDDTNGGYAFSALRVLRSMRLMRAFRLLGRFPSLRSLFYLVLGSMREVSILTLMLAIFIFIFAALGWLLFNGELMELGDGRTGRWRFDTYYWSWINVFMVVSGDSWNEIMYDTGL